MALGQVNVPGAAGVDATIARQVAQQAKEQADAALRAANSAGETAGAAMQKAADAESTAGDAENKASEALEKANGLEGSVKTATDAATAAEKNAATAQQAAEDAAKAAQNAQQAANDALDAITKLNSVINSVPTQSGSLTYTGSAQSPQWNGYDEERLTIGGTTSGTNAGSYNATFTPKAGYEWADGTTTAKTVSWTIGKASLATPAQSGTLTYTGSEQTPSWSNYDSNKLTIGGTSKGTNAGSYNATFTPKANYQWNDGTTTAKTVSWSIGKAAGSLTLGASSVTLDISTLEKTVAVTRAGDGAISATSSNTSVAKATVSGTNVVITGLAAGDATITVKVAAGTNHTAPANKTIAVSVSVPSASLADNTPETIQAAAKSGQAANYWSVGDKMGIALSGTVGALSLSGTYYAFILGFNHNSSVEGGNSIHFQFGKTSAGVDIAFCDSKYGNTGSDAAFRMNTSNSNSGGWNGSYMRKTICPAFLSAMPSAWQSVIAACTKYSDNTGGGSNTASYVTTTSDKIWLLSEFEVQGTRTYANSAEQNYQKQYDYYKNGNSKVKYKHNATTTACYWWLRSVYATFTYSFCIVYTDGSANSGSAYFSSGFAPGFKVA